MRSIQRRFNIVSRKKPNLSSLMRFSDAIKRQGFSKEMVSRWFNKLVEKDDYEKEDKRKIIQNLMNLTSIAEDNAFSAKKCARTRVY